MTDAPNVSARLRWLEEDGLDEDTSANAGRRMNSSWTAGTAIGKRREAGARTEFFRRRGSPALNVREGEDENSHAELPRYGPPTFITTLSRRNETDERSNTSVCAMTRDWRIDPAGYLKRVMREVWKDPRRSGRTRRLPAVLLPALTSG